MSTQVRSFLRPDGRCLVRAQGIWTAPAAAAAVALAEELRRPLLAHVDGQHADELDVLRRAGFTPRRRDVRVVVPVRAALERLAGADLPSGLVARSATDVDADRLRDLDDELRDDVPGTSGWRCTAAEFRADTFDDPAFDPRTYLVAVDEGSGGYVGLVRIWMNPHGPRLGFVGVRSDRRRRGIASALLRRVLAVVAQTEWTEVSSELDEANQASRVIHERLGARRVGTTIELCYGPLDEAGGTSAFAQERSRVG